MDELFHLVIRPDDIQRASPIADDASSNVIATFFSADARDAEYMPALQDLTLCENLETNLAFSILFNKVLHFSVDISVCLVNIGRKRRFEYSLIH